MTWIFYALGVLLHVAFKWAGWARKAQTWKPGAYFRAHGALNVQAAIAAAACACLWELGVVPRLLGLALASIGAQGAEFSIPITPATSLFAGYVMDSMGRTLLMAIPGAKAEAEDK